MRRCALTLLTLLTVLGCAPTSSTGALPVEVLVLLDQATETLVMIPVDSTEARRFIGLAGVADFVPRSHVVRDGQAVVVGDENTVIVVDLASGSIPFVHRGVPSDIIEVTDAGVALLGSKQSEVVVQLDLSSGQMTSDSVRGGVGGFGVARGQAYAVVSNRLLCPPDSPDQCESNEPSWLVQIDADQGADSIPISGPGNGSDAVGGSDGLLYVVNSGDGGSEEGRLSVVDPVSDVEIASYGAIGPGPHYLSSDGGARVLIASQSGGMMVFDIHERRLTRGFGAGIPLSFPAGVLADALGRVYVVQRGGCTEDNPGSIKVFGQDLVERLPIEFACPAAAGIGEVSASLFADLGSQP